jgi:type IV pilus assembly protein PilM
MNLKDIFFSRIYGKPSAFGLDISDFSIKVAQLKKRGRFFELKNYNRISIPEKVVEEGIIKNREKLIDILKKSMGGIKGDIIKTPYAVCSLPEQHGFIKIIQLPKMRPEEVKQAIRWEAEANIPFSLDEVYLSWQIIPSKRRDDRTEVLISAAPKNLVDEYLEVFREANIEPAVFEIESTATVRSLIKDEFSSKPVLVIDLGFTRTSFIIFAGQSIRFTSSISTFCTKEIIDAVAGKLNTSLKEPQLSKIKIDLSKKEEDGKIFNALLPCLTKLIDKIRDCINFYRESSEPDSDYKREISEIIICGGGAHLRGLSQYLSSRLKIPVKLGNPWINIPYSKNKIPAIPYDESPDYATVLGLALRGIEI